MSLVTSVTIRKHVMTSMYREILLTSVEMFDDKKGTFSDKYSSGLSFVKLLTDILVTSRHIASF